MFPMYSTEWWILVGVLAALYVGSCVRVSLRARQTGRSAVLWFFITLCFTAIPASVVFFRDYVRARREALRPRPRHATAPERSRPPGGPMRRCPHCRRLIAPGDAEAEAPFPRCPHCGLPIDEAPLA